MNRFHRSGGNTAPLLLFVLFVCFRSDFSSLAAPANLRLIVETDAGGDPDDEQSLVRLLLYANDLPIESIIANRATARDGENKNPERTGLGIVRRIIDAYDKVRKNLAANDPNYPTAERLRSITVPGYNTTDEGERAIIRIVDSENNSRPIWYMDWGTDHGGSTNNLDRALNRVLAERGPDGYAKFKSKINMIFEDRLLTNHTRMSPPWHFWVNTWQPPIKNLRWYHRFSAITSTAGGFNVREHILKSPFGDVYPTNTTHWQKEGDTMAFLYLVPTGLNDPTQPTWGSWAGRYGLRDDYPNLPYYWANQTDSWNGSTNRDNTLARWAAHLQNDFRARLEWASKSPEQANHPPRVVINGNNGPFQLACKTNETINLTATGSDDPDKRQQLKFEWIIYPETGTYRGDATLASTNQPSTQLRIPTDAAGKTIHVV